MKKKKGNPKKNNKKISRRDAIKRIASLGMVISAPFIASKLINCIPPSALYYSCYYSNYSYYYGSYSYYYSSYYSSMYSYYDYYCV